MNEAQILARMQEIMNLARSENRDLTDAETREYDELQRQLNALRAQSQQPAAAALADGQRTARDDTSEESAQEARERAIEAERTRVTEITALCRQFGMEPDEHIREGRSIDEVRRIVLQNLSQSRTPAALRTGGTGEDRFRSDMESALMLKAGLNVEDPSDESRRMRTMSLRSIAEECLVRDGMKDSEVRRMDPTEVLERVSGAYRGERQFYNPTAAFPAILDNAIKKSIVEIYNHVPTSFQTWTTKGSLPDFKETKDHEYLLGGAGEFLEVSENGEIKHDTPSTIELPTRQIKTYGRQFTMTREAFINDDISFMTKVPGLYAQSAKRTIDRQVYSILFNNNVIFDGVNLFAASHGNLMTNATKPTQQAIQAMILAMQKQKDPFGEAIYMTPQFIIVPTGYGFDLDVILHSAQVVGSSNNDKNPLYNYPIQIVETPVLNALAGEGAIPWFLVSNQMSAKSIQVDYLNGVEIPTIRRMETPGKLGFVWDIYLDWGVSVRDFRGIVKNPGVAMN